MSIKVKSIGDIYDEGLWYLQARQKGIVRSVKTPWSRVNNATVEGFEWGTIITVAGRPGTGKTTFLNQFTRAAHSLNPDQNFHIIDLQFEMPSRQTAVREFSSLTGLSYKQLLSAGGTLDNKVIEYLEKYAQVHRNRPLFCIDTPMTVLEIRQFLLEYYATHRQPMIVTLDHSILVRNDKGEKDKFEMLFNLGEMLTEVKKLIPIIFIILTQMNRSIEDQTRKVPGTIGNYPTSSDIFGADALMQHSDLVLVLNHPAKNYLLEYGPERYQMQADTVVLHFIKSRNGDMMMCFFQFNGASNSFVEIPPPLAKGLSGGPARYPIKKLSTP